MLRKAIAFIPWALLVLGSQAAQAETLKLIRENGVLVVPVEVNDAITLNFTVDSGASDVVIPQDVFSTLSRAGTIAKSDMLDSGIYVLADGSRHEARRFRIRSLRLGGLEVKGVIAGISPSGGALLLGQSLLSRLPKWSVDNGRGLLVIGDSGQGVDSSLPGAAAALGGTYEERVKRWLDCAKPFTAKIEASSKYQEQLSVTHPRFGLLWSQWNALTSRCAAAARSGSGGDTPADCSAEALKDARSQLVDKILASAEPDAIRGFRLTEGVTQKAFQDIEQSCGSVPQQ